MRASPVTRIFVEITDNPKKKDKEFGSKVTDLNEKDMD
jgi:hypothetical protein